MLQSFTHLLEWAALWPGTPGAVALGAAAVFAREERWTACVVAVVAASVPLMLSGGTGGRFLGPTAGLLVVITVGLWWCRESAVGSSVRGAVGVSAAVALMAWQAWQAGSAGLAPGLESTFSRAWWLLGWPGTGLVTMVALSGLRLAPRAGESVRGVRQYSPFVLAVGVAIVLSVWEGRARILEASIVSGLLFGGSFAVVQGRAGRRSTALATVAVVGLVVWSGAVRHSRGAGPYLHPEGLISEAAVDYEVIDAELQLPSSLAHSPDGRVFVADFATDIIWVYTEREAGWEREVFARWPRPGTSSPVVRSSEAGLWGLAVHPGGGWVYAMGIERWSVEAWPDGRARGVSRVLRFEDSPGGQPAWEEVLTDLPAGSLHSGGALAFGPEGALYLSVGEGGHGGPGRQDFVGTILRLAESPGAPPVVFARGLRNPYGLSFDPAGRLYATENGPDCCDRLLRVEQGDDFGWHPSGERLSGAAVSATSLWDSGASRIGPTGIVAGGTELHFVTWHTAALHSVVLGESGEVTEHSIRFEAGTSRPPQASVYRFAGGFTGLSAGPEGQLWFTAVGTLGRFSE